MNAVMNGKSIVVATSTASGKSLCYNVPVLEELSKSPNACALYLFPTKVLFNLRFLGVCTDFI